jgi:hypothetical protein
VVQLLQLIELAAPLEEGVLLQVDKLLLRDACFPLWPANQHRIKYETNTKNEKRNLLNHSPSRDNELVPMLFHSFNLDWVVMVFDKRILRDDNLAGDTSTQKIRMETYGSLIFHINLLRIL